MKYVKEKRKSGPALSSFIVELPQVRERPMEWRRAHSSRLTVHSTPRVRKGRDREERTTLHQGDGGPFLTLLSGINLE